MTVSGCAAPSQVQQPTGDCMLPQPCRSHKRPGVSRQAVASRGRQRTDMIKRGAQLHVELQLLGCICVDSHQLLLQLMVVRDQACTHSAACARDNLGSQAGHVKAG